MTGDRKALLGNLDAGDIFMRRHLTPLHRWLSQRQSVGQIQDFPGWSCALREWLRRLAVINSVAPLPPEIRNVFLGIERKYGQIKPEDWDNPDLERFKLTEAEKKALRFVGPYYASNSLPSPDP
jgi:hypothetical protein